MIETSIGHSGSDFVHLGAGDKATSDSFLVWAIPRGPLSVLRHHHTRAFQHIITDMSCKADSLPVYHICPTFAPALALGSLANAGDQERTKTRHDGTVPCSPSCLAQNCGLSPPPFTRQVARAAVSYSASESLVVAPWYVENGLLRGLFWLFWR